MCAPLVCPACAALVAAQLPIRKSETVGAFTLAAYKAFGLDDARGVALDCVRLRNYVHITKARKKAYDELSDALVGECGILSFQVRRW